MELVEHGAQTPTQVLAATCPQSYTRSISTLTQIGVRSSAKVPKYWNTSNPQSTSLICANTCASQSNAWGLAGTLQLRSGMSSSEMIGPRLSSCEALRYSSRQWVVFRTRAMSGFLAWRSSKAQCSTPLDGIIPMTTRGRKWLSSGTDAQPHRSYPQWSTR